MISREEFIRRSTHEIMSEIGCVSVELAEKNGASDFRARCRMAAIRVTNLFDAVARPTPGSGPVTQNPNPPPPGPPPIVQTRPAPAPAGGLFPSGVPAQ